MTANQWLLFIGVPALFAVVAIIVDWWATRRRRIDKMISRTFRHEEPRGVPGSSSDLQSGTDVGFAEVASAPLEAVTHRTSPQPPIVEQTDPLAELARLIESTRRKGAEGSGEKSSTRWLYSAAASSTLARVPWAGRIVDIHEVVEKASGHVARRSLDGEEVHRLLELPTWMLDRVVCAPMRMVAHARVDVAALYALTAMTAHTCDRRVAGGRAPNGWR